MLLLSLNCGIVLGYAVSSSHPYRTVPLVMMVMPVLFVVGFSCMPETPQFLLKSGKPKVCDRIEMLIRLFGIDMQLFL